MLSEHTDLLGCLWCQETPNLRNRLLQGAAYVFREESVSKVPFKYTMVEWIEEKFKATGVFRCEENGHEALPCRIVAKFGLPTESYRLSEMKEMGKDDSIQH